MWNKLKLFIFLSTFPSIMMNLLITYKFIMRKRWRRNFYPDKSPSSPPKLGSTSRLCSNGTQSLEVTNIWPRATENIFLVARLGDWLVLVSWFTVKKKKENVVQSGAHWYSKFVPREFTCNIIIDFDCDKPEGLPEILIWATIF